jgi:flagellar FliL protein
MAEENVEEAGEKKGGNPLMLVIVILLVVLLGIVGFLVYMLMSKGVFDDKPEGEEQKQEKVEKKEADEEASEFFKTEIKDLVLNITNAKGREKLMKLSFTIKSVEPTAEQLVADNNAEIIDAVIQQVSARSSEELLTAAGKELLREELISEINVILNEATASNEDIPRNHIKDIFFTTFVIK